MAEGYILAYVGKLGNYKNTIMKEIKMLTIIMLICFSAQAGGNKTDTVYIKTSAICTECKERIEGALAYEKGVISADLTVSTAMVKVVYKVEKTNPEEIRKAIAEIGYDADNVKANSKSYDKLPKCCKKE